MPGAARNDEEPSLKRSKKISCASNDVYQPNFRTLSWVDAVCLTWSIFSLSGFAIRS